MNKDIETVNLTKCSNTIMADEIVSKLAEEGIISSLHDELDDPVMAPTDQIQGLR